MSQGKKLMNVLMQASTVGEVITTFGASAISNIKDTISNVTNTDNNEQKYGDLNPSEDKIQDEQHLNLKQVDFKVHIAIDFGTDACGIYN